MAGHLPALETAAVGWQSGQHQPDCLAALLVAHDVLVRSVWTVTGRRAGVTTHLIDIP